MQIFNKAKFIGGKFTGPLQLVQQSWGISKESFKKGVPVLGGLGGLALALGHTALAGFVTGAIAGGTAGAIGGAILGAKVGAAVGTLVGGPVGAVIGGIAGGIAGGVAGFFIGAIGGGLAGMGIALSGEQLLKGAGNFVTGAASGLWNGITAFAGNVLSGAGSFLSNVIGALGTATVPTAAIGIPVATALTLTISLTIINNINTSTAYLDLEAEPTEIKPPGETDFFTVTKTASVTKLDNSDLPYDITFTITLTAKNRTLSNIQITDEIKVQKTSGDFTITQEKSGQPVSPPCAANNPPTLAPSAIWNCQLVITAPTQSADSVLANTVTVKATPEGENQVSGQAVASVAIGKPPTICGIIELTGPWSGDEKKNVDEVCKTLDKSPKIVSLLQNAGAVNLIRVANGSLGAGVCGTVNGANTIRIGCPMINIESTKYVIIHELSHIIGNYNGSVYNAFISIYKQEGLMPTYPFGGSGASESFPEMISDYIISKSYSYPSRAWSSYPGGTWNKSFPGWNTFKEDRPLHYNFAKNEIFGGVEYQ